MRNIGRSRGFIALTALLIAPVIILTILFAQYQNLHISFFALSPNVSQAGPQYCAAATPGFSSSSTVTCVTSNEAPVSASFTEHPVFFLNDRAGDITGARAAGAPGFIAPGGLTGAGQIVAVADSGLDAGNINDLHPDLQSVPGQMPKVVLLKSWAGRVQPDDPTGHGTHMAATIAGTGAASNGQFRGVAPGASIYFQAILNKNGEAAPPADLADLFLPAYSAGARVHVDGWGGGSNLYGGSSAQIDRFVRAHPDFLPIFGAGNTGPSPGTVTTEANSKNALAVGASVLPRPALTLGASDTAQVATFSSCGPAGDGRIKPELLAPASAVISARSRLVEGALPGYQGYTSMQGTSMAAAVAGGSATLLREYFKEYMNITTPSAALLKATLINGARPATAGPSKEGFGVIDLAGTVIALKDGAFCAADEWAGVTHGGEVTYTYRVTGTSAPFKATLAWSDPPAEPGGTRTLVNDLDLAVRTPDGRLYHGNHFLGGNTQDRTNNIEQVYLPNPVPGDYTVSVTGAAVRRAAVIGGAAVSQDYALVCGQAPVESVVVSAREKQVTLSDGFSFNPAGVSVSNLINDSVSPADTGHVFTGAAAYRTPARIYLAARLWRADAVKVISTVDGTVFTVINPDYRLGGYVAAKGVDLLLNGAPAGLDELPVGVEISAVVNPVDQKIRQARAAFTEHVGVVSAVRLEGGQKKMYLAGGQGAFTISRSAAYSYEDSYAAADIEDIPFGTGALDALEEALPGMPVRLHIAPSSREAQYLAVKRRVVLGTVRETAKSNGEIRFENGLTCRLLPGAPVKRDREDSSLEAIRPGDHVAAVLLPDTGEVIGVVAYSNVIYGRAIDYVRKNRTLYILDDNGRYLSFHLPSEAVVYRWGVRAAADAITTGSRIRVITCPGGEEALRLDIAETLFGKGVFTGYNEKIGIISTREGGQYRISDATCFYKNGTPVLPEDLLPGEQVELEYAVTPSPTGDVLFSINARSAVQPPVLIASVVPFQDRLALTGRTGVNSEVYIWKGNSRQAVPVDESGRFNVTLFWGKDEDCDFTLVALDRRTGGVAGRRVGFPGGGWSGAGVGGVASKFVSEIVAGAVADASPDGASVGSVDDGSGVPVTRAQAAIALARLLNWPDVSSWPLIYKDAEDFPLPSRPAVAEAQGRGVFRGYPGECFLPQNVLSRAEAAVVLAAVLRDLGVETGSLAVLPYTDAAGIPSWATESIAAATAAGLFHGRPDGAFAPGDPVTAGEMSALLDRLLACCRNAWEIR